MKRSKYFEVNQIMGESSLYNDKISTGRSLKWYTGIYTELIFKSAGPRLLEIPYVKNIKQGRGWVRVYV
jgi:hypothetical protein